MTSLDIRDRLIVALDMGSVDEARALVGALGEAATFYKIGYRLGYAGGLGFAGELIGAGKKVFLDLKLHDIGNTVQEGVESLARVGATFLTVHAYPQTMRAALAGRGRSSLKLLAVTVLTSYDDADAREAGYAQPVDDLANSPTAHKESATSPVSFARTGRFWSRCATPTICAGFPPARRAHLAEWI